MSIKTKTYKSIQPWPKNVTQKLIENHLVEGRMTPGENG